MGKEKKGSKYEIDMTGGPIFSKLLVFSIPLMLSGILQLLFNTADVIVVGRFAGSESLAAVGSTSSLTNLLVNLFIGLSIGTNVVTANYYGARKSKEISDTVHTSVALSIISGLLLAIVGFFVARPTLTLMGTPSDVLEHSIVYMRIYFLGMPVMMLYNFGSAILRAVGDTRRPLRYLTLAGFLNVILNLIFVILFKMGVAGVALATVISQALSAFLVVRCLMQADSDIKLELKKIRLKAYVIKKISAIGIPAGIQGALFSISNVLIQSSVNSFGSVVMAGNTAAQNVEGFVYTSMNAVAQTAVSFVGQNVGANNYERVKKVGIECLLLVTGIGLLLGNLSVLLAPFLIGLYSENSEVINSGVLRLKYVCTMYCLCGIMETFVGCIRGLGKAIPPTIISLIGACALRIIYIMTYFKAHPSLGGLFLTYPISWFVTSLAQMICLILIYKKQKAAFGLES